MNLVPGIPLARLLHAISVVESSGGRNSWPRVEASYIPAGESFTVQGHIIHGTGRSVNDVVKRRWRAAGDGALWTAASYGRWQILYHTAADAGFCGSPFALMDDDVAYRWVVAHLERIVGRGARTLEDIGDAWNSGTHRDGIVPSAYIAGLVRAWEAWT